MVDAQLQDATNTIVGEIVQFDIVSLLVGLGSLLVGLFGGEVIGQLARSMVQTDSSFWRTIADIAARTGVAGVAVAVWSFAGGMTIEIIAGMVAIGIVTGIVGQVVEGASEVLASLLEGERLAGQQDESTEADLGDSGYGGGSPSASDTGGGTAADLSV